MTELTAEEAKAYWERRATELGLRAGRCEARLAAYENLRAEVDRQLGRHLCYTSPQSRDKFWRAVDAALDRLDQEGKP